MARTKGATADKFWGEAVRLAVYREAEDDDGEAAHGRTAKVDTTTGEVKKAQPKWDDAQRTEIGHWFSAIIQGVEGGDKIVQDFRLKYKYTDPAKVIELAKELAKEHAVEP
jgi:hypothetical protein